MELPLLLILKIILVRLYCFFDLKECYLLNIIFIDNATSSGIGFQYTGGAACGSGIPRTTTVYLDCDTTVSTLELYSYTEPMSCTYEIR